MAAVLDLENVPGKKGDPFRGQAVHYAQRKTDRDQQHMVKLPAIPVGQIRTLLLIWVSDI
jgi:hypothetical protein